MAEAQINSTPEAALTSSTAKKLQSLSHERTIPIAQDVTPPASATPGSRAASPVQHDAETVINTRVPIAEDLADLFAENMTAKIYRTGLQHIPSGSLSKAELLSADQPPPAENLPSWFPEVVPQTGPDTGKYHLRDAQFWTSGFFPGTLHAILERLVRFPSSLNLDPSIQPDTPKLRADILALCKIWAEPLHAMAHRRNTHDIGFLIMPALRQSWELTGDQRSLASILTAARSLASRYLPGAKCIRSWDARIQGNLQITCSCQNGLLIIDSMCNLDLLYYAAGHAAPEEGREFYRFATEHADKLLETHLRPEAVDASSDGYGGQWYSTYHVANVDPATGSIKQQFTAQGYSDTSRWARGQAWGILGYAQTYMWTKDVKFLHAACGLSEYFLHRCKTGPAFSESELKVTGRSSHGAADRDHGGRFVPLWDFDAPEDPSHPTRDSSAAAIAANGMLIISQALAGLGDDRLSARFRRAAVEVVRDLLVYAVAPEKARFVRGAYNVDVVDEEDGRMFEGLMRFGSANNNEHAPRRYADTGIVYGDYYLVEFGNRLLRMGLV